MLQDMGGRDQILCPPYVLRCLSTGFQLNSMPARTFFLPVPLSKYPQNLETGPAENLKCHEFSTWDFRPEPESA